MSFSNQSQSKYWTDGIVYRSPDHPTTVAYASPKCDLIRRHSGLPDGASALDVGTGNGTFFFSLQRLYPAYGLDLSPHLLRMHCAPGRILRADARQLPFAAGSYDLVVESCVLHHVHDQRNVVAEMARVARRAICLIEPNMRNPLSLLFHALVPEERGALKLSPRLLRDLLPPDFAVTFAKAVGMVYPNRTPRWLAPYLTFFDRPCPLGNVNMVIARRKSDL